MQYCGMKLDNYLNLAGRTDVEFARAIDRDPATVGRLRRGLTKPDWDTMARIRKETEGAVSPNDFLDGDSLDHKAESAA